MTRAEIQREIMELPEEERMEIADAIWTSLSDPDSMPLPAWQTELLAERLAASDVFVLGVVHHARHPSHWASR